ncbi:MAG TPA: hypothetical protein VGB78_02610 [Thermoplasmata archaeon]
MSKSLKIGREEIGISGLAEIMEKGCEVMDQPETEVKQILLVELKRRNYVPDSAEAEYMRSLWTEFKKKSAEHRELMVMTYKGIPREEIPWFPKVDEVRCTGCSSCADFCVQGVFTFDGKSHVTKPFNCIIGKTSCRSFCPDKAISFPTLAGLKETLRKLKDKHGLT